MGPYKCYKKIQANFLARVFQCEDVVICFHLSTSVSTSNFFSSRVVCLALFTHSVLVE